MAGIVTGLVWEPSRRGRVNVYIDGEQATTLTPTIAAELRVGQALTDETLAALRARDEVEAGYEACLGYLAYRPRSERELTDYLARRGVSAEATTQVIARLRRNRLADDAKFAAFWVQAREARHPRGQWALRSELQLKGVGRAAIERAVAVADDAANAQRAATEAARRYARCDEATFRRRMLGYLQRRGFGLGIAREAVDRAWRELQAEHDIGE